MTVSSRRLRPFARAHCSSPASSRLPSPRPALALTNADDDMGRVLVASDTAADSLDVADEMTGGIGDQDDGVGSSGDAPELVHDFRFGRCPFVRFEEHELRFTIECPLEREQGNRVVRRRLADVHAFAVKHVRLIGSGHTRIVSRASVVHYGWSPAPACGNVPRAFRIRRGADVSRRPSSASYAEE
jgi:hypothetical protein